VYAGNTGNPLPDTQVLALEEVGGKAVLGMTDDQGHFELPTLQEAVSEIVVSRNGYARHYVSRGQLEPGVTYIGLNPEDLICGAVRSENGLPIEGQVSVIAIRSSARITTQELWGQYYTGSPKLFVTTTSDNGSFCLTGLTKGGTYDVRAGGSGYIMPLTRYEVEAGESNLDLVVRVLYGVQLRCEEKAGQAARIPEVGQQTIRAAPATDRLQVAPAHAVAFIAGLDPIWIDPPTGWALVLYTSSDDLPQMGPVEISADFPGYAPFYTHVWVSRVKDGLADTVIPLTRESVAWGAIVLQFSAGTNPRPEAWPNGFLELKWENGEEYRFEIESDVYGSCRLAPIPQGWCRVAFRSSGGLFRYPVEGYDSIEIGPEDTLWEIPVNELGSLQLHLNTVSGLPFEGAVQIAVATQAEVVEGEIASIRGGYITSVRGPPFIIKGLTAGKYYILLMDPAFVSSSGQKVQAVQINAASRSELDFVRANDER
jgi:hypothetical protein